MNNFFNEDLAIEGQRSPISSSPDPSISPLVPVDCSTMVRFGMKIVARGERLLRYTMKAGTTGPPWTSYYHDPSKSTSTCKHGAWLLGPLSLFWTFPNRDEARSLPRYVRPIRLPRT